MENKNAEQQKKELYAETEFQNEHRGYRRRRKALDKYLEGWTVRETLSPNGNLRKESVYVGDYFFVDETRKQRVVRKIAYVLLFAVSIFLTVIAAIQPVGANLEGYVGLSQGLVLLSVIFLLPNLFSYITSGEEMTVGDFKGGPLAVKKASRYMALANLLPAVTTLVHLIIDPTDWGKELLCAAAYLAAGAVIYLMHLSEQKLAYDTHPSPDAKWANIEDVEE